MVIENPRQQLGAASDSIYKAYQIKDIAVFIDDFNTEINTAQFTDSTTYQGVGLFSKGKLKYKPQALVAGIAIQKNKPYSDLERNLTIGILQI